MSESNPTYTAGDVITDVEARLLSPNLSASVYIPWISYAYQKLYSKLIGVGQDVKEELFGDTDSISLTVGQLEYTLIDEIPRYGGIIKVAVKYGGTGDTRQPARRLRSKSHWRNIENVSTSYQAKDIPLYYIQGGVIGIIPTAPESGAVAYIDFVKRPYQITESEDEIDIPYRFIYPIINYVHARAVERTAEDYGQSAIIEKNFQNELEEVALAVASEFNENEANMVEVATNDVLYDNPFDY